MTRRGAALVTGGSRGVGAAIALELARAGWDVGVCYRAERQAAEGVVERVTTAGGRAVAVQADLAEHDAAERLCDAVEEAFGPLRVLVNNAGARGAFSLVPTTDDTAWSTVIETNLDGTFRMMRRALRTMIRQRQGRIVNVASVLGSFASPGGAAYGATKAGLMQLTKTVAVEVARRGITVNAVAPGLVASDMSDDVDPELVRTIPLRRVGAPAEVAAVVRFLVSPEAGYITGTSIVIDGGFSAGFDPRR